MIVWTLLFNLDVWAHMVEFCCYNYILYMLYKWCNIIIWKYFFNGRKVFTAGSRYEPALMGAHHQRLAHASPPWWTPSWPRYHYRLKSNGTQNRWWCTFRTGGDRGGCSSDAWHDRHAPTPSSILLHPQTCHGSFPRSQFNQLPWSYETWGIWLCKPINRAVLVHHRINNHLAGVYPNIAC